MKIVFALFVLIACLAVPATAQNPADLTAGIRTWNQPYVLGVQEGDARFVYLNKPIAAGTSATLFYKEKPGYTLRELTIAHTLTPHIQGIILADWDGKATQQAYLDASYGKYGLAIDRPLQKGKEQLGLRYQEGEFRFYAKLTEGQPSLYGISRTHGAWTSDFSLGRDQVKIRLAVIIGKLNPTLRYYRVGSETTWGAGIGLYF